jgi:hypothetical protein
MALFNLFNDKKVANSDVDMVPVEINDELDVNNENESPVEAPKEEDGKKNLITITWGTGMPIDVIFNFIHKNFEEEGFQDALVNSDIAYRDIKEKIICNDLAMLFKRIVLRYKNDIREVEIKIDNARKAYALTAAARLESLKQTYEEHLSEIKEMQDKFAAEDPKMMTMIESYRRGFLKGITASTIEFIENK